VFFKFSEILVEAAILIFEVIKLD